MLVQDSNGPTEAAARGCHPLAKMFTPTSVALIGASDKSIWSRIIHNNFQTYGFQGALFAVNRDGKEAHGLPGFRSCADIPQDVDCGFIFVPQSGVLDALEDAAAAGIGNVVVLTSGYAEVGGQGAVDQEVLLARAKTLGVNLWGPNSLGFSNIAGRAPMSAIPALSPQLPGSIAIVSQSGATAMELYEFAQNQNIGCSFVAATGNEGQIALADVIDYLVDDPQTKAIAVFAEMVRDPDAFKRVALRARLLRKPVVVLKIGRSELSNAVAQAHTGSLVGDDRVFSAVCDSLGVIRVRTAEELINTTALLAATGPLQAGGLSFLSISGGACTLVADAAEEFGVALPAPDEVTLARLKEVVPSFASTLNPLDVTGAAVHDPDLFERLIPIVAAQKDVGLVGIGMNVPTSTEGGLPAVLAAIGRATQLIDKPAILIATCAKNLNQVTRDRVSEMGLPHIITSIEQMLRAVGYANWWSAQLEEQPSIGDDVADARGARPGSERETLDYLRGEGCPVIAVELATTAEEAGRIAEAINEPLAMKIASPDIAHKTEVGGVRLAVAPSEAIQTYHAIIATVGEKLPDARIDGVILSPMRVGGLELIVGITRDRDWGPVLAVGLGGVMVELLDDAVLGLLPIDRGRVKAMLGRLRGAKLLQGFRGAPPANIDKLADAIVRISDAALRLGTDLDALEVNPLLVCGDTIEALDALALWQVP